MGAKLSGKCPDNQGVVSLLQAYNLLTVSTDGRVLYFYKEKLARTDKQRPPSFAPLSKERMRAAVRPSSQRVLCVCVYVSMCISVAKNGD